MPFQNLSVSEILIVFEAALFTFWFAVNRKGVIKINIINHNIKYINIFC